MRVELLWWEGCPSYPEAIAELRELMREEGLDPDALVLREVMTDDDAARERFPGSPTIRVDGEDVVPPGESELSSLTCRVYRLRDGRYSPIPDPADVRAALRTAKEER
jgi:hypothetical protein